MVRKSIGLLLLALGFASAADAQTYGGGNQVFSNWTSVGTPVTISATTASSQAALPSIGPTARICNTGSSNAYVAFGTNSSVVATSAGSLVKAGTCQAYNLKPFGTQYTNVAGIASTGTTTLRVETGVGSPLADAVSTAARASWNLFTDPPYNGSPSNTPAQNDTAAAQVSADCNSGALKGLFIPAGTYSFSADNPFNLTTPGQQCDIGGVGPATVLLSDSAGTLGTFFTCNGSSSNAVGCAFHDVTLRWNNTQAAGKPALLFGAAGDGFSYNIRFLSASELAQFGTATSAASRIHISHWSDDFNHGGNEDCNICIVNAANLMFSHGALNGAVTSDTNPNGAFISLIPVASGLIDTVEFDHWYMQSGTTHGKPYGVKVDTTNGPVYNLTFDNNVFDWTTTAGVSMTCPVGSVNGLHVQNWSDNRITPGAGASVIYDCNNGIEAERIQWSGNHLFTRDGTIPFQILAAHDGGSTKYVHDGFFGGDVEDIGTATTAAFGIGADGWEFSGPSIGRYQGGTTGFAHVYDVTAAGLTKLVIGPGNAPTVADWILEPTYSTIGSLTRQIWRPRATRTISSGASATAAITDSALFLNSATPVTAVSLFGCTASLHGIRIPIIDEKLTATASPVTITPVSGTIEGGATFPIDINGGSADLQCDGNTTNWVLQ